MPAEAITLISVVALATLVTVISVRTWRRRRLLRQLRQHWGGEKLGRSDLPTGVGALVAVNAAAEDRHLVDDQTCSDLDLDEVLSAVDRTLTPVGVQCLYRDLRLPHTTKGALRERRQLIKVLREDRDLRERIQLCLAPLNDRRGDGLVTLLFGRTRPRFVLRPWVFRLTSGTLLLSLAVTPFVPPVALVAAMVVCLHTLLHVWCERTVLEQLGLLRYLAQVLGACEVLAKIPAERLCGLADHLQQAVRSTRPLQLRVAILKLEDPVGLSEFARMAIGWDFLAYNGAIEQLEHGDALRHQFLFVGELDVALSTASLLEESECVQPEIGDQAAELRVNGVRHPCVSSCVPNDFESGRNGLLITGGNMAGKSTFIKAVAVNAILAQSLDVVFAHRYEGPPLRVLSALGAEDDLVTGRSYYCSEAEAALRLVKAVRERGGRYLLVVDELYRGTNSTERVAASAAVLTFLAEDHLVIAATHDLELVQSLQPLFDQAHFTDIDGVFDYRLRPGECTVGNAIATLERLGYPRAIVDDAEQRVVDAARSPRSHGLTSMLGESSGDRSGERRDKLDGVKNELCVGWRRSRR